MRACSRLALGLALLTALGGSTTCSWTSGNHDDDDASKPDDDDDGIFSQPDDGGGSSGGADLAGRLAGLSWTADAAPSVAPLSGAWPDVLATDYALLDCVTVPGGEGQAEVLRLVDIQGISLLQTWGPGSYGAAAFAEFSQRVLDANGELLALPPGAGSLRPAGVEFLDDLVLVRWLQTEHATDDLSLALPGAALTMAYDLVGRLIQIENAVQIPGA